ncbi:methyl-accepting chemotaxis protein [Erwinia persicina]|uniref:methyl-accepting chemotaxis protein n=1 Tax=Erwinia persicina TaxID=55211 RepID=UPI00178336C5|nr:methyl-accepting chemotaxis protein [Erwinia persicina]MBD8164000.1 HAMP domain-containing protein [Erwinia persicina]MBD8215828.1 HAMP domain-containing protein [Erwinia persicina]
MKRLLNNINLPAKFLLLAFFSLMLFAVPSWLFIQEGNQQINVKELELQGIPVEKEMLNLLNLMQRHRAEAAIAIATNDPATPNRLALKARIDQLNAALLTTLSATRNNDALLQRFNALTAEWEQLQRDIDSRNLTLATSLNRHAEVIRSALDLNVDVLDFYSLSLDADLNTYQFIISSFSRLPDLTETLGQIRARGTSLLAKKDGIEDSDYARMEFQIRNGRNALRLYNANLKKSFETDEEVRAKFSGKGEAALQQASEALKIAEDVFVNRTKTDLQPAEFVALFTRAINQYNTFGLEASDEISRMLSEQISAHRLAQVELLGVLAVLALFVVILGVYIIRSITGPVSDAAKVARDVASGDLTSHLAVTGNNEMAGLIGSLMQMRERLSLLVADIKDNATTIATSSEEIAQGNGDLSARTEEQAASLAQTAASMEELSSIILQNADNTRYAAGMASSATDAALLGGEAMESVLQSMQKISASAGQIEEIISVIDSIAFQTNILALNAAVEAARAGEHGKGFAVVAAEVRALAQRSATAAKEIKQLIGVSVDNARQGIAMAQDAGDKVKQSVGAIEQTAQLVNEISASSQEQSAGISQINIAVNQMDQVTQQNAVLVEQSASSADELAARAVQLRELVAVFRTAQAAH